jgi:tRNA (guanine-N7-)-methyltransferase
VSVRRPVRLPLEQLAPYLLELPAPPDPSAGQTDAPAPPIDWKAAFGNDHPVELEVGSGKGLFLLNAASSCPDVNFAGVEIEKKYVLFTAARVAKRGLGNVRLAQADARAFLRERVPAASLQAVHVYFPDPWWKNRHHKRRVFTEEFARQCARVLSPGGKLHLVTDVEEYFLIMTGLVAAVPDLRPLPPPQPKEAEHDLDYLTNFERKFRKEGKPIYRALYERAEVASGEAFASVGL